MSVCVHSVHTLFFHVLFSRAICEGHFDLETSKKEKQGSVLLQIIHKNLLLVPGPKEMKRNTLIYTVQI